MIVAFFRWGRLLPFAFLLLEACRLAVGVASLLLGLCVVLGQAHEKRDPKEGFNAPPRSFKSHASFRVEGAGFRDPSSSTLDEPEAITKEPALASVACSANRVGLNLCPGEVHASLWNVMESHDFRQFHI